MARPDRHYDQCMCGKRKDKRSSLCRICYVRQHVDKTLLVLQCDNLACRNYFVRPRRIHQTIRNRLRSDAGIYCSRGCGSAAYRATQNEKEPYMAHNRDEMMTWIVRFIATHSYPPSVREIGEGCDISSTGVVEYHLKKLEKEGRIRRTPLIARSIVIVI